MVMITVFNFIMIFPSHSSCKSCNAFLHVLRSKKCRIWDKCDVLAGPCMVSCMVKGEETLLTPESISNTLPVVIFGPLATKSLDFLGVWGLADLFSVCFPTCYQWWVGKEKSEILNEKKNYGGIHK